MSEVATLPITSTHRLDGSVILALRAQNSGGRLLATPQKIRDVDKELADKAAKQIKEMNEVVQSIQDKLLPNPDLDDPLSKVNAQYDRLQGLIDVGSPRLGLSSTLRHPRTSLKQRIDGRSRSGDLGQILARLRTVMGELLMRSDVQVACKISRLEKLAATRSPVYSNADLHKLPEPIIQGWTRATSKVYTRPDSAEIHMTLTSDQRSESIIHFTLTITSDFRKAVQALAGRLSCFSNSLEYLFPDLSEAKDGEITLRTPAGSPSRIILWVYHNIFVYINLSKATQNRQPGAASLPDVPPGVLVKRLFDYIRSNTVPTREQATLPIIDDVKAPSSTTVGQTFEVEMNVGHQHHYHVAPRNDKIIYTTHKDTEHGRKYNLFAVKAGEGIVDFCFAHHETLNYHSTRVLITIEERNLSESSSDDDSVSLMSRASSTN